ncbi:peroxisomal biogenesis factor 11-domain-containing protein [Globomyces pollinis-pini]|nr:peroxisomal biogenesis factor 11-domain-containing protein [Globomyces pollinis-pini]KAJ2999017.1 hypothetical protein HDV02_003710 [Globomyces sp. JEL0801]
MSNQTSPSTSPTNRLSRRKEMVPEDFPAKRPEVPLLSNTLFRILVFRKLLLLNDGRDKLLKVAQYTCKVLLWIYLTSKSENQSKAKLIASHFSLVRKCIRLGHALEPFHECLEISKNPSFKTLQEKLAPLNCMIGIANDIADDIICLSKLGAIDKSWVKKMTPYSDRLWYTSIFFDIHSNLCDTQEHIAAYENARDPEKKYKAQQKIFMGRVSLIKLLADFVFCSIDVFEMGDRVSDGWQAVTGLTTAVLGTYKLYVKNK